MRKMKKLVLLALFGGLILVLAGCGIQTDSTATKAPAASEQAASDPSAAPYEATDSSATGSGLSIGQAAFEENCSSCHNRVPRSSNIDEVVNTIEQGEGRMPSFKGQLSDSQIQAIATYVTSK